MKLYRYNTSLKWTGNTGKGTSGYQAYERNHQINADGKMHPIMGASDPSFMGDPTRYNPEELFLASLSACHMLWYLHLCAVHQIIVTEYTDHAEGLMEEDANGAGRFTAVTLYPKVKVMEADTLDKANELHEEANRMCFIANSCNFKIGHKATIVIKE